MLDGSAAVDPGEPAVDRYTVDDGEAVHEADLRWCRTQVPRRSKAMPRTLKERIEDVRQKLHHERDLWMSTAARGGRPHLVPLSYWWTGRQVVVATEQRSRSYRNLRESQWCRLAIGSTRDVVILEGDVDLN